MSLQTTLDMDSIDALTNAIKAFEGSCIIVTHSEEFLRAVCDRLIVFTNDGADYFNGTYDEFLEKLVGMKMKLLKKKS